MFMDCRKNKQAKNNKNNKKYQNLDDGVSMVRINQIFMQKSTEVTFLNFE